MTRNRIRYYLHNLDGLKIEISDINADLEQYRAMQTDEFIIYNSVKCMIQQDKDKDPYQDTQVSDGSQHSKYSSNSQVEQLAIVRLDFIKKLEQELFEKKLILDAINCVVRFMDGYDKQIDKKIIQLRYAEHLSWEFISHRINYNTDYLKQRDKKIVTAIISNYNARIS